MCKEIKRKSVKVRKGKTYYKERNQDVLTKKINDIMSSLRFCAATLLPYMFSVSVSRQVISGLHDRD